MQGRKGRHQSLEDESNRRGGHDQAGDEKVPMSTQETRSQDENRLAKEG